MSEMKSKRMIMRDGKGERKEKGKKEKRKRENRKQKEKEVKAVIPSVIMCMNDEIINKIG